MLDSLDLQIIEKFHNLKKDEEKNLSDIVREILKKEHIGNKEYNKIHRRILKMSKEGIFKIGKNGSMTFILDLNRTFIMRFSFPTRRSKGIAVLINDKYQIFEL